jgi:hypothetical protein
MLRRKDWPSCETDEQGISEFEPQISQIFRRQEEEAKGFDINVVVHVPVRTEASPCADQKLSKLVCIRNLCNL